MPPITEGLPGTDGPGAWIEYMPKPFFITGGEMKKRFENRLAGESGIRVEAAHPLRSEEKGSRRRLGSLPGAILKIRPHHH